MIETLFALGGALTAYLLTVHKDSFAWVFTLGCTVIGIVVCLAVRDMKSVKGDRDE